jgi:hypothetical protein
MLDSNGIYPFSSEASSTLCEAPSGAPFRCANLTLPQVRHWLTIPHVFLGSHRETEANDVGIVWPRRFDDVDSDLVKFQEPRR